MKTRLHMTVVSMMVGASLALVLWPSAPAHAWVSDTTYAYPPNGWDHLCTPHSISVSPRTSSREYSASATCWVNLASDKSSVDQEDWVQAHATMTGRYFMSNNKFNEAITVNVQSGPVTISVAGALCTDDPWATQGTCSTDMTRASAVMYDRLGWRSTLVGGTQANKPLSSILFDPALVQAQLQKQQSNPPSAPAGVKAVLWPTQNGTSEVGNISWHAGDMSGNKWVLMFDVEYAQFADGTFVNAGHRVGPGPKKNMSPADANRVYVFTPTTPLQKGGTYFFRVCATNDAGRQCSATVQARQPTLQERASRSTGAHAFGGGLVSLGGNRPGGGGSNPTGGPIALGTARPGIGSAIGGRATGGGGTNPTGGGAPAGGKGPVPLGSARPIGPVALGAPHPVGTSGGPGAVKPAGAPPTSIGGSKPGTPARAGTPGIAVRRPIGPIARVAPRGGTQPGTVAFPDLALGRGMFVRGSFVPWGGGLSLRLRADATHVCPVQMSFRFRNAGRGPAQNVTAVLRDSQNPMVPVAAEKLASMAAGQSSSVGGVLKVAAAPAARRLILAARVHEAGRIHEKNVANDRGSITLNVACR